MRFLSEIQTGAKPRVFFIIAYFPCNYKERGKKSGAEFWFFIKRSRESEKGKGMFKICLYFGVILKVELLSLLCSGQPMGENE